VIVKMIVESRWNVDWQGKPKFSEKTCPSATLLSYAFSATEEKVVQFVSFYLY
jgi:hypothetical protein